MNSSNANDISNHCWLAPIVRRFHDKINFKLDLSVSVKLTMALGEIERA